MFLLSTWFFLLIPKLFILTQLVFRSEIVSCTATSLENERLNETKLFKQFEPMFVSLKKKLSYEEAYKYSCSASIISRRWILTAGHCCSSKHMSPIESVVLAAGSVFLSNKGGVMYKIDNYVIHPNFTQSIRQIKNDLCLVKTAKPIRFTESVQPVTLGTIKDEQEVPVIGGGWGQIYKYGPHHKKLRLQILKTMKLDECQRLHDEHNNIVDRVFQICGYGGIGKTLCFGDSGSPVFDVNTGYQVAVFHALEDCSGHFPVLFMRIEAYIDWINYVTKLNFILN